MCADPQKLTPVQFEALKMAARQELWVSPTWAAATEVLKLRDRGLIAETAARDPRAPLSRNYRTTTAGLAAISRHSEPRHG
ncbi:MAG: hypothetical protein ACLGJC_09605 [Alphaproteobacteria bacterium]